MTFDPKSISQGELHALKSAAEKAWNDDTRHPEFSGDQDASKGQCYVTSFWLTRRLGGFIGEDNGHYVWVSSDKKYVIDLTCDRYKYIIYKSMSHPLYRGLDVVRPKATERSERFADRAENIFKNLNHFARVSMDYAGDALPAEEPQAQDNRDHIDRSYMDHDMREPKKLNFSYADGQLIVDDKPLESLVNPETSGPIAVGTLKIDPDDNASWEVETNIGLNALSDVLKQYCNSVGLSWSGLSNMEGHEVASKTSYLYFVQQGDECLISHKQDWSKIATRLSGQMTVGTLKVEGDDIQLPNKIFGVKLLSALNEYADDNNLKFVLAGNDNVVKRIEDLEEHNFSNPNPANDDGQFFNDTAAEESAIAGQQNGSIGLSDPKRINGLYQCPECEQLLPSWHEFIKHREAESDTLVMNDHFPNTDPDATFNPHFTPRQPQGVGEITFMSAVDPVALPIPFIYDVEDDSIVVGDPGMQVADLSVDSGYENTVQGVYDSKKLLIKSTTTIPYTVRHLIRLWYYQHPELKVNSVELQNINGGTTKLANTGSLVFIGSLSNSDVEAVTSALLTAGCEVFAVGNALKVAKQGEVPTPDMFKVVSKNKKLVRRTLEGLGELNLIGLDQGAFTWRRDSRSSVLKIFIVEDAKEIVEDRVDLRDGRYEA